MRIRRVGGEARIHGVLYLWQGCLHESAARHLFLGAALADVGSWWRQPRRLERVRPLVKPLDIPRPAKSFICGATAGALASFLVNPFDVVKTQQQVRSGKALPSFGIMRSVYEVGVEMDCE